jgi:hypothetical protein
MEKQQKNLDMTGESLAESLTPTLSGHGALTPTVSKNLTPTQSSHLAQRQEEVMTITALIVRDLYHDPEQLSDEGIARLTARNRALASAGNDEIMQSVGSQSQILEALFHKYTLLAQDPKLAPAVTEAFMRIAFAAERLFLRAAAVMATLKTLEKPV